CDEAGARKAWEEDHREGRDVFSGYLEFRSKYPVPPSTPVGDWVRGLELGLLSDTAGVFYEVVEQKRLAVVEADKIGQLPQAYQDALAPVSPVVVVPLIARNEVIGL